MPPAIKIGNSKLHQPQNEVNGTFVTILGERYFCIENYDRMPPFFMSIVSNSDHWMFISSTGGLTAGRQNAESAIFPYDTDDKVTESYPHTGPISIFLVTRDEAAFLWEPFSNQYAGLYKIERKLYKNVSGNKLVFEENNLDLGLTYCQSWRTSDKFGFILTCWLHNHSDMPTEISLLSGVQNVLPFGVTTQLQTTFSNLLNAYKRSELEPECGLGIFSLSSTLTDLAEPSESLKASTIFQVGLENPTHLLSTLQVDSFRKGDPVTNETDIRGYRGAYLLSTKVTLTEDETKTWILAMDVNQDSANIAALVNKLKRPAVTTKEEIESDIVSGSRALDTIIASADGLQTTADRLSSTHHYANVLFNSMRGGIFANNYKVEKTDLIDFLRSRNHNVFERQAAFLDALPDVFDIDNLIALAGTKGDQDLERLCTEYLPLTFSRRHGDPSRPWNRFSINLKNPDGNQRLDYQGNWRDLFQNWEALACSYPEFVEGMIATFINAGTPDGYNPYRVSRDGVEWEVPEPDNPWANIGYWSDHQIIYLQKLMEISLNYHPGKLANLLTRRSFSYVNVPYRLREYDSLLKDPYKTIDFDYEAHRKIEQSVAAYGSDGKLVHIPGGSTHHVTLSEKLLVFLLAKLINFVPEGGIWMNTQRPEWNDANNALVGKGISVVTLGYLRRYVDFWLSLLEELEDTDLEISKEVKILFNAMLPILEQFRSNLDASFSNEERRSMMDALGQAGSVYRWNLYKRGFSGEIDTLSLRNLQSFLKLIKQYIEHALRANLRADGLYHAYNILKLDANTAQVSNLYEMLEGQVSILSSGLLTPEEALKLLKSMRQSALYRADQHSYILYPDRNLPAFNVKNRLPLEKTSSNKLVQALVKNKDASLIVQDENGEYHFNGNFRNERDIRQALEKIGQQADYSNLAAEDGEKILDLFEDVFHHDSFTGRSGTFFAYEGLGSIYWHMVSKLLLAVQENYILAIEQEAKSEVIQELAACYYDIRKGLGFNKSPQVYGAFPTDPYSHTPKGQGAKQPGMTGQVKEEILTRLVELGVFIRGGQIIFDPVLLREEEFTSESTTFEYFSLDGTERLIELTPESLAFTFCQTPIIYHLADKPGGQILYSDGRLENTTNLQLDKETSQHIFKRDGYIKKIDVFIDEQAMEWG